ncbi:MAG: hypothetical protein ACK2U9_25590 [Anaerolineae bacterium]
MPDAAVQPGHYVIRLQGNLAPRWAAWFEGLAMTYTTSGETILSGPIADQAALHGVLDKVRDLNVVLISVNRVG